jgi:hypothetical protein
MALFETIYSSGRSPEAAWVEYLGFETQSDWRSGSVSFGPVHKRAMDALYEVSEEAKADDWDGDGGHAVSSETYRAAYAFLEALSTELPSPSVAVTPDGSISLEWYRAPYCTLAVCLAGDQLIHYSALLGPDQFAYGTETLCSEIPESITHLIARVTGSGNSK